MLLLFMITVKCSLVFMGFCKHTAGPEGLRVQALSGIHCMDGKVGKEDANASVMIAPESDWAKT